MAVKDEVRRKEKEQKFCRLCSKGDLESIKALLTEDPSLINSRNKYGKFKMQ